MRERGEPRLFLCGSRELFVSESVLEGSSLKDTSWATSARFCTLSVPVLLMTMGIFLMSTISVPWIWRAC